jgi:hypothetical protein
MRRLAAFALMGCVLAAILALARPGTAAEWNGIEPGLTNAETIRARFGSPSKETKQKVEGYDTFEWIYEGDRAPAGFHRMSVEFGILLPAGYSPSTVRVLRLDPKRFIFTKDLVVAGWGEPDRAGTENGRDVFFYRSGLVVTFDEQGVMATTMFFTVKQPDPAPTSAPAPAPAPARRAPSEPTAPAPSSPAPGTPPVRR